MAPKRNTRFNGQNKSWEKVLAFLKSTWVGKKLETPKNNRLCVPMAFELPALRLDNFHLRLHCYTLIERDFRIRVTRASEIVLYICMTVSTENAPPQKTCKDGEFRFLRTNQN